MTAPARERVRLKCRPHGIVLAQPLVRSLALAAAGGVLVAVGWPFSPAGAAGLVLAAAWALRAAWRWDRTLVVVTTDRLLVEHGTLHRRQAAAPLAGVVEVEQTLAGRLLGYATVVAGDLEIPYVPRDAARLIGS